MTSARHLAEVEADLARLQVSVDRARTALACLFSTAAEFEAAVLQAQREAVAFPVKRRRRVWLWRGLSLALACLFLVI
jgi:hypothetical protein